MAKKTKKLNREIRHRRVRAKIKGTAKRPRLSIFKSNKHLYIQLIDDNAGKTLSSVSYKEIKDGENNIAYKLGKSIAKKSVGLGVKKVVFDRGGYKFHGSIKNVALGAREGGLEF
ncbi:MAG: 50S ribosomal protein L18 [Patescibacteria group bacterium]